MQIVSKSKLTPQPKPKDTSPPKPTDEFEDDDDEDEEEVDDNEIEGRSLETRRVLYDFEGIPVCITLNLVSTCIVRHFILSVVRVEAT